MPSHTCFVAHIFRTPDLTASVAQTTVCRDLVGAYSITFYLFVVFWLFDWYRVMLNSFRRHYRCGRGTPLVSLKNSCGLIEFREEVLHHRGDQGVAW